MITSRKARLAACAVVVLVGAGAVAAPAPTPEHLPPRRDAMIAALGSANPHPSLGAEARAFDQLVGTWDCDYTFYAGDGSVRHSKGELLFGWVLDGRAVQDIWISYPAAGERERRIGTSVRFFDTARKRWRVVFVGPQANYLVTVEGAAEGDRIVLTGVDADGAQIRWSFNDIGPDSFVWRGEKSRDGGASWTLEEEHHMRRRA